MNVYPTPETNADDSEPYRIRFDIMVKASDLPLLQERQVEVCAVFAASLKEAFALPNSTPARVRLQGGPHYELKAVGGVVGREPSPDEVRGVMIGAVTALKLLFRIGATYQVENLKLPTN